MWPKGGQVIRVFDACTGNFRKPAQEIGSRSRELVATDESPVTTKPFLDAIVVEDGQCYRRFPDTTSTDESDWTQIFRKGNDAFDEIVASETGPGRRGRRFSK